MEYEVKELLEEEVDLISKKLEEYVHHASPMMKTIAELREKYDLHMRVERYTSVDDDIDSEFVRV